MYNKKNEYSTNKSSTQKTQQRLTNQNKMGPDEVRRKQLKISIERIVTALRVVEEKKITEKERERNRKRGKTQGKHAREW